MSKRAAYAALVARGCLCRTAQVVSCPVHPDPRDNRGLRAYFEAGQPGGFPMVASCAICGTEGLLYPNVELDDPARSGEFRPTLICPRHSVPSHERALRADADQFGYELNEQRVFAQIGREAA